MAHQYFMQTMGFIRNNDIDHNFDDVVSESWGYVDTMQAEADKREKAELEEKRTEMRKLLNADNTFIEREGQHFDDVNWQPDWSRAPVWANWAAVGSLSNKLIWSATEPEHINIQGVDYWDVTSPRGEECKCYSALTSYTGDWRNSVRKRP